MILKFNQIFENVVVCGDIHEDFMPLVSKINEQYQINNSLIIVAGDVGIGFNKDGYYIQMFKKVSARLEKKNNTLLFIRGNHDDPDKWMDYKPFKDFWQESDSNIRLVKDYTVIEAKTDRKQHNILCVGGAISIDRKPSNLITMSNGRPWPGRNEGKNYWSKEAFVYDESKIENLVGITDVITHSAPDFCAPTTKSGIEKWILSDNELENDCNKERREHTLLYNKLKEKNKIDKYIYGHFHFSNNFYFEDTLFKLCDIMELTEL